MSSRYSVSGSIFAFIVSGESLEDIMISVRIRMIAKDNKLLELKQTAESISANIGLESGCQRCTAYQEMSNPNAIIIDTDWDDQKAVEQHLSSNNISILAGAQSILAGAVEVFTGFNEEEHSLQGRFNKRFGRTL